LQPKVFKGRDVVLGPAPIQPDWIISGNPVAENNVVVISEDRALMTIFWRCSAGAFQWIYDEEETIYILDGGMTLTFPNGEVREVGQGDVVYFAAGTVARWDIASHVHKVAVFRRPTPKLLAPVLAAWHRASSLLSRFSRPSVAAPISAAA
jgi:uncharacterized cupin superfamily protein